MVSQQRLFFYVYLISRGVVLPLFAAAPRFVEWCSQRRVFVSCHRPVFSAVSLGTHSSVAHAAENMYFQFSRKSSDPLFGRKGAVAFSVRDYH